MRKLLRPVISLSTPFSRVNQSLGFENKSVRYVNYPKILNDDFDIAQEGNTVLDDDGNIVRDDDGNVITD